MEFSDSLEPVESGASDVLDTPLRHLLDFKDSEQAAISQHFSDPAFVTSPDAIKPAPLPLFSERRKFTLASAHRRGSVTADSEEVNISKHRDYVAAMQLHVRLVAEVQREVQIRYDLIKKILAERSVTKNGAKDTSGQEFDPVAPNIAGESPVPFELGTPPPSASQP